MQSAMEGGEDKHDESERGIFQNLVNDQGAPVQNPPHGSHPPPQVYPPAAYHYPPGIYAPAYYPGPSHHPGHRIEAMAYGAQPVGYNGGQFSYGSHGIWKHGKFKHRGGKFRHGKHGKFRMRRGGKFRKWK